MKGVSLHCKYMVNELTGVDESRAQVIENLIQIIITMAGHNISGDGHWAGTPLKRWNIYDNIRIVCAFLGAYISVAAPGRLPSKTQEKRFSCLSYILSEDFRCCEPPGS
jgi:hypothetical protein